MKFHMVVTVILASACFVSVQALFFDNTLTKIQNCKRETQCDENIIQILQQQGQPQSDNCFCAIGCIAKATGFMSDAFEMDSDKLEQILKRLAIPDDKAKSIATNCQITDAKDQCEAAKKFAECMESNL